MSTVALVIDTPLRVVMIPDLDPGTDHETRLALPCPSTKCFVLAKTNDTKQINISQKMYKIFLLCC